MRLTICKPTLRELWTIAFAIAMVAVPWPSIFESAYGHPFVDRNVYLNHFLFENSVLDYVHFNSLISYVSREFVWHYSVRFLTEVVGVPIGMVFSGISILVLLVFSRIVLLHAGVRWLPFLINPLVVDFAFSQLRLALAMAILGAAYLAQGGARFLLLLLCLTAPLIHTGSLIFIGIYAVVSGMRFIVESCGRGRIFELVGLLALGALISLMIGPLREVILSLIGDRRITYPDMSSSVAYSLFWVCLLIPLCFGYRGMLKHDFSRYTVVILSLVAVNLTHGGYSTRFLAATFPFIIATVACIRGGVGLLVTFAFITYAMLQWLYWFRIV